MNRSGRFVSWSARLALLAGVVLLGAEVCSAQQVLRIAKFTVASPDKQQEVFAVTDEITALYAKSEAFRWLKFSYDPDSGENVAVSLWTDRSGMEAAAKSDEFKASLEKMKRLSKGDFSAKVYQVYQPKKPARGR
ncbi:MAG: hypothetical protein HUU20_28100 [Pirellulales bacterium]|nr:hypothetical protein [Pirellulales bacterium]